jgi:hypothetical protein
MHITAICLEAGEVVTHDPQAGTTTISMSDDPSWFNGPPYAVVKSVFDEYDNTGMQPRTGV